MAQNENLLFQVSQIILREKMAEGGFKYICDQCDFACLGRKKIINHLKENHGEMLNTIQEEYEMNGNNDFEAQLSKLVMNVPFCDRKLKNVTRESNKDYPTTLDFMKIIDTRTTMIPGFGGLMGRLARLLAMIVTKEKSKESESHEFFTKISCSKCKIIIGNVGELHEHLFNYHENFLQNLNSMFPLAKERMHQFIQQAVNKFELVVPTGREVDDNQFSENKRTIKRKRIDTKSDVSLDYAKHCKGGMASRQRRKQRREEQRQGLQNTKSYLNKFLTLDSNTITSEEGLRIRKEISVIENALKDPEASEVRKNRLLKKKNDLESKVKAKEIQENVDKCQRRIHVFLNKLSPTQLQKLFMEYFDNLESFQTICWKTICEEADIGEDFGFMIDFLGALYDLAKITRNSGFKVGHILVTSNQAQEIVEKGFRSYRDFVKSDAWRIPDSLNIESFTNLGEDWNINEDSRLLIGASKFGRNLGKIMNHYPTLKSKCLDSTGSILDVVKERFDYILHIYQNRGVFNLGFSQSSFYKEDMNEEEMVEENDDEEEGEI